MLYTIVITHYNYYSTNKRKYIHKKVDQNQIVDYHQCKSLDSINMNTEIKNLIQENNDRFRRNVYAEYKKNNLSVDFGHELGGYYEADRFTFSLVMEAVIAFADEDFSADTDPTGEHLCGLFRINDEIFGFKITYFNYEMTPLMDDKAKLDESKCFRVMLIGTFKDLQ